MDKRQNLRWTFLLSALTATVGAIVYPQDEPLAPKMMSLSNVSSDLRTVAAPVVKDEGRPLWIATDEDPFAARIWEAPPPPEVARAVQSVETAPAEPSTEAPPPPLPYRFLGQMQDDGNRTIYLGHGDQVLLARQGEVLEGSYKVVALTESTIEFESVQSGLKQTLPIPAQ